MSVSYHDFLAARIKKKIDALETKQLELLEMIVDALRFFRKRVSRLLEEYFAEEGGGKNGDVR